MNCPFLHVDGASCLGSSHEQVCLAAKERRDLKHVRHFCRHGRFFGKVDVRDDADAKVRFDLTKHIEGLAVADAGEGVESGAVGLAVAGLDVKGQAQLVADALDLRSHGGRGFKAFHRTWTGEHVQGLNGG